MENTENTEKAKHGDRKSMETTKAMEKAKNTGE
jgi:hypothetical protein